MPESLEHTIIHYQSLFKDHKPMEAYQLITLGYHNIHENYGGLEIWINKEKNKGVLLEVTNEAPRQYKLTLEYDLGKKVKFKTELEKLEEEKN